MSYFVYVLINDKGPSGISYVGYTNNLKKRIKLHNEGKGAKFTRGRHWKIIYTEKYDTRGAAISREHYIKKNRILRNEIKRKFKCKKK